MVEAFGPSERREEPLADWEGLTVAPYIGPRDWDAPAHLDRIRRLLEVPARDWPGTLPLTVLSWGGREL